MASLRSDPTRTTLLRKRFSGDMRKRFNSLKKAIQTLVVEQDAFGLVPSRPFAFNKKVTTNATPQVWRFLSDSKKIEAYRKWLKQQVDAGILVPLGGISGKPWTAPYIESAYTRGAVRAYTDTRAAELTAYTPLQFSSGQAEFLRTAFAAPVATASLELLYTRSFTELEGITSAMSQQMSRILADGFAQGFGVSKIASQLKQNASALSKARALLLARTEIIRAHAEGQLDAFEFLGVKQVGIWAEWTTAGDERVCPLCGELDGAVMKIEEARGLIPRHPNCRCTWMPAGKKRQPGQAWGKEKNKAVKRSIQAESPKTKSRSEIEVRRRSVWAGKKI